jgi:hypothetical protein
MLSDEVREKIVLALTGTARPQIRGESVDADGVGACAVGVICEGAFGGQVHLGRGRDCTCRGWGTHFELTAWERTTDALGEQLYIALVNANDSGRTFDEIAKLVKEWEG